MRFMPAVALLALSAPAMAGSVGMPTERFVETWTSMPSGHFTPDLRPPAVRVVAIRARSFEGGLLADAVKSASDEIARRDIAIDEMASAWEPARRTALEDLRAAQRNYVAMVGGDAGTRDARFAAMLHQVVDGSGRSVAQDGRDDGADQALAATYDRVIRDAPDTALAKIEASEAAWIVYRDAFGRFAEAMDHPDAARGVRDELARRRIGELEIEAKQ